MKKRILLGLALVFLTLIALVGCGGAPKPLALIVSSPDNVVFEDQIDTNSFSVYRVLNSGQVQPVETAELSFGFKRAEPASEQEAGIWYVNITDLKSKDPNDKNKQLTTSVKVIRKSSATAAIKEADSFLVFNYTLRYDANGRLLNDEGKLDKNYFPVFLQNLGYTFNVESFEKQVKAYKVGPSEDGSETVVSDVTTNLVEELKTRTFSPVYKQSTETVTFPNADGKVIGEMPLVTTGGQKPIHSKSANWFDYILVIPVGWLMQLLSFGGIYGLGILFATIVIRTLAWPIYARTNAMSTNMTEAQPELQRLEAKYRGRTDKESIRQKQMEQMQIYKKYKIGMSSMFLPFLQMPIFIAMYQTVSRILVPGGYWASKITVRSFLGLDLTIGNHWTSYILAAIVGATMILLQWLSQRKPAYLKKTADQNKGEGAQQAQQTQRTMKIFSYVMVIMMVVFSLQNNALALYWIFGNIFSIGQTAIHKELNRRKYEKKQEETLGGIL